MYTLTYNDHVYRLLSELSLTLLKSNVDANTISNVVKNNSSVQNFLIQILDPQLAEIKSQVAKGNSKTSSNKKVDEGETNYLNILNSGGAFKNLNDILKAVTSLNKVVTESKPKVR